MEGTKKIKSTSFHQYSWNYEVETTWINLIGWHHKTSSKYCHTAHCLQWKIWALKCRNVHLSWRFWSSNSFQQFFENAIRKGFKAYVSEEILNWHCLSLSLNADLCIHFYWLSWLRQASHRKRIQSAALRLRLWLRLFIISSDTPAFSLKESYS